MHKTMRGKPIDMQALIAKNSHVKALGNANMNARGDVLGMDGQVTMTSEQINGDYHKVNPKAVKQVPLRTINQEMVTFDSPAQAVAKHKELAAQTQAKKRKIVTE